MNKPITIISVLAAASILAAVFLFARNEPVQAAGFQMTNIGYTATTSQSISVTSSTRLVATTTNPSVATNSYVRIYATICNPSSNPVAINMNADKAANVTTGDVTTWIAAAAGYDVCYYINDQNQYLGSITASSTNQTATAVSVQQFVQ